MHRGVTLWSRDEWTYRALGGVLHLRGQRGRPAFGTSTSWHGRRVVIGRPKLPYGRATGRGVTERTVTHCTDRIGLAYRGGVYRGAMMLWLCGNTSTEFEMSNEVQSRWCATCWLRHQGLSYGDGRYADLLRKVQVINTP